MTSETVAPKLIIEVLNEQGLRNIEAEQWDELSRNSLDNNPFYGRSFILAGLNTIDRASGLRAVIIRSSDKSQLLGMFPFRLRRFPLMRAVAATNLYQFCSQPLIHRDYSDAVIAAWTDALETKQFPHRWSFPHLDLTSRFAQRLSHLAMNKSLRCLPLANYSRARLTRSSRNFAEHLSSTVSKSRVKDIQRSLRRLEELGEVRFERATDPALVTQRIEQFLAVEHAGWKGTAGTSFQSNAEHARFAREAFSHNGGQTCVDSLLLDGSPIALSVNLRSGETIFTPKCAYDESYRKYSPGLVLEYLIVEAFYASDDCTDMDSSTTVDGHVIQSLWNADAPMGTLVVGPQNWGTNCIAQLHTFSRTARQRAKALHRDVVSQAQGIARTWRRHVQRLNINIFVGGTGLFQTLEHLLPRAI
jgi:CelD/BcsL family acetyltransferase involved in cellulose biosynthesis